MKAVKDAYKVVSNIVHLVNYIFNGVSLIHSWGREDGPKMNLTFQIYRASDDTIRYFQHFITSTYISYYKGAVSTSNMYIFRYYQR